MADVVFGCPPGVGERKNISDFMLTSPPPRLPFPCREKQIQGSDTCCYRWTMWHMGSFKTLGRFWEYCAGRDLVAVCW